MNFTFNITPEIAALENEWINSTDETRRKYRIRDLQALRRSFLAVRYMFLTPDMFLEFLSGDCVGVWDFAKAENTGWTTRWYTAMFKANPPIIVPGKTPATVHYYSDHRAGTVMDVVYTRKELMGVKIPRQVTINANDTECVDYYAGDYNVKDDVLDYKLGDFSIRKNGGWVMVGQGGVGSVRASVGFAHHYIDPSF